MKFQLYRVPLNSGGYTSDGQYYGVGRPLYRAVNDDPSTPGPIIEFEFRAGDREEARAEVLSRYPNATFYR